MRTAKEILLTELFGNHLKFLPETFSTIQAVKAMEIYADQFKNKPGRPKKLKTKKHIGLRLSQDIIDIIRSKPNQAAYIEALVRNNPITLNQE